MTDTPQPSQDQSLVKTQPSQPIGRTGISFSNMDELFRFAKAVSQSGLAPKGLEKPEAIFVAVQLGLELGLSPMAALQNIGVINGRPGIYGDAALALVRASGLLEDYSETTVGKPCTDDFGVAVESRRAGMRNPMRTVFMVSDAKRAQLWGKPGPWTQYPERMLKWRARGFNLRDNFGDVLKGLKTTEELGDLPATEVSTQVMAVLDAPKAIAPTEAPKPKPAPKPAPAPNSTPVEEPPGTVHALKAKLHEAGITEVEFFKWAHAVEDDAFRVPSDISSIDQLDEGGYVAMLEHFNVTWFMVAEMVKKERKAKPLQETLV